MTCRDWPLGVEEVLFARKKEMKGTAIAGESITRSEEVDAAAPVATESNANGSFK